MPPSKSGMSRACDATNKAGSPCQAAPLLGRPYCRAHDPDTPGNARFGGSNGGGRPRKPRAGDVLRERIETDIDKWLKPLEDSLEAGRAVVVGTGPNAWVEVVPDYAVRLRATADALDRVYGRPAQSHEVKHSGDASRLDAEIDALLAEMSRREGSDAPSGHG